MNKNIFEIANMSFYYTHAVQNYPNKPFSLKILELRIHGISKRHIFDHFWLIKFGLEFLLGFLREFFRLFSGNFSLDFSWSSSWDVRQRFFSSKIYLGVLSGFQSFSGINLSSFSGGPQHFFRNLYLIKSRYSPSSSWAFAQSSSRDFHRAPSGSVSDNFPGTFTSILLQFLLGFP